MHNQPWFMALCLKEIVDKTNNKLFVKFKFPINRHVSCL